MHSESLLRVIGARLQHRPWLYDLIHKRLERRNVDGGVLGTHLLYYVDFLANWLDHFKVRDGPPPLAAYWSRLLRDASTDELFAIAHDERGLAESADPFVNEMREYMMQCGMDPLCSELTDFDAILRVVWRAFVDDGTARRIGFDHRTELQAETAIVPIIAREYVSYTYIPSYATKSVPAVH